MQQLTQPFSWWWSGGCWSWAAFLALTTFSPAGSMAFPLTRFGMIMCWTSSPTASTASAPPSLLQRWAGFLHSCCAGGIMHIRFGGIGCGLDAPLPLYLDLLSREAAGTCFAAPSSDVHAEPSVDRQMHMLCSNWPARRSTLSSSRPGSM